MPQLFGQTHELVTLQMRQSVEIRCDAIEKRGLRARCGQFFDHAKDHTPSFAVRTR